MLQPVVTLRRYVADLTTDVRWLRLKEGVAAVGSLQSADGSIDSVEHEFSDVARVVTGVRADVIAVARDLPHDEDYLAAVASDLDRWIEGRLGIPDFARSLTSFRAVHERTDGLQRIVVLPISAPGTEHRLEVGLMRTVWPAWVAALDSAAYRNPNLTPLVLVDGTDGYAEAAGTPPAEPLAARRRAPGGAAGATFCDREATEFDVIITAIAEATALEIPAGLQAILVDQHLGQEVFVARDLVHDRAASRSDLPFDPFMIRQRMPFWMYAIEELRCDLTAYWMAGELAASGVREARLVQDVIILNRALCHPTRGTGGPDHQALAGQVLFAYLHQLGVVSWVDSRLIIEWAQLDEALHGLLAEIEDLYWHCLDRPRSIHWLAAYALLSSYLPPHPGSRWAQGVDALPIHGSLDELIDAVRWDEFPLSMFFEALGERIREVLAPVGARVG